MNTITLIQVLVSTYFLAVNVYGFILINFQRKNPPNPNRKILQNTDSDQNLEENENNGENFKDSNTENKGDNKRRDKNKKISDARLFITGILGGSLGIYVAMFVYKYRLSNFFLMVFIPVFLALNVYIIANGFLNGFWIAVQAP